MSEARKFTALCPPLKTKTWNMARWLGLQWQHQSSAEWQLNPFKTRTSVHQKLSRFSGQEHSAISAWHRFQSGPTGQPLFILTLAQAWEGPDTITSIGQDFASVINLTALTTPQTITGKLTLSRDADHDVLIGFYHVLDTDGTVLDALGNPIDLEMRVTKLRHSLAETLSTISTTLSQRTGLSKPGLALLDRSRVFILRHTPSRVTTPGSPGERPTATDWITSRSLIPIASDWKIKLVLKAIPISTTS